MDLGDFDSPFRFGQAINTANIGSHVHLYFAKDIETVFAFADALDGIASHVGTIPKDVVHPFRFPQFEERDSNDLLRWMSLVHVLAWDVDSLYLRCGLEYQLREGSGFFPWSSCERPEDADPLPWLLHRKDDAGGAAAMKAPFRDHGVTFPEFIHDYLLGDVLVASSAAIDVLVYRLGTGEPPRGSTQKSSKKRRTSTSHNVNFLKSFLADHHNPRKDWDPGRESEDPNRALTQNEIGEWLGWSQSKVSRLMGELFPPDGMKTYVACIKSNTLGSKRRGIYTSDSDGQAFPDGVVEDAYDFDEEI